MKPWTTTVLLPLLSWRCSIQQTKSNQRIKQRSCRYFSFKALVVMSQGIVYEFNNQNLDKINHQCNHGGFILPTVCKWLHSRDSSQIKEFYCHWRKQCWYSMSKSLGIDKWKQQAQEQKKYNCNWKVDELTMKIWGKTALQHNNLDLHLIIQMNEWKRKF